MTTEYYLGQIRRLDRMIANKTQDIENLESKAMNMVAPMDREPIKSSGTSDKIATFAIMASEESIVVDKMVEARKIIINQIDNIDDSTSYEILTMFYVLNATMQEIADTLGYSYSHTKRLKQKAVNIFENNHGKSYLKLKSPLWSVVIPKT